MFLVESIFDEAKQVFGHCNEKKLFRWITEAIDLLANKGEFDPLFGYVDICVTGGCISLPREVENVIAVNIGGHPSLGHDELFSFHLNGPGDFNKTCDYSWFNTGGFPTYRDLACPSKLIAFLDSPDDSGKSLRIFGFDSQNRPLRSFRNNAWVDGYFVPTVFGYALPDAQAPDIARITDIVKDITVANVRLSSFDNSTSTGTLLGVFEPTETVPRYRRIRITNHCDWVRIAYRKRTFEILSLNDRIFLHSRLALILAFHAVQKYREADLGLALQFEAQATRILTEKESTVTSPVGNPIQVNDRASIKLRGMDNWID